MAYSGYASTDFGSLAPDVRRSTLASISRTLGLIGLGAWLLPVVGLPITFLGLVIGVVSFKDGENSRSLRATLLCALGLVLTLANAAAGMYIYIHAQKAHPASSPQQITNPHYSPSAATTTTGR